MIVKEGYVSGYSISVFLQFPICTYFRPLSFGSNYLVVLKKILHMGIDVSCFSVPLKFSQWFPWGHASLIVHPFSSLLSYCASALQYSQENGHTICQYNTQTSCLFCSSVLPSLQGGQHANEPPELICPYLLQSVLHRWIIMLWPSRCAVHHRTAIYINASHSLVGHLRALYRALPCEHQNVTVISGSF